MEVNNNEQAEYHFFFFAAENAKSFGNNRSKWGSTPPRAGKPPRRVGYPPLSVIEYMKRYKECWLCYGKGNSHQQDHNKCAVYVADKKEYFKLHPERVPKEERIQNCKDGQGHLDGGGQVRGRHVRQIKDVAESLFKAG